MKGFINKLKNSLKTEENIEEITPGEEEYVELDTVAAEEQAPKVYVRPFVIEDFSDIKIILDSLRQGNTVALINIKPLKDKDLVELKRAISKLKKTCNAIDGDIAGFGDDYIVVVPKFAKIHRTKGATKEVEHEVKSESEFDF